MLIKLSFYLVILGNYGAIILTFFIICIHFCVNYDLFGSWEKSLFFEHRVEWIANTRRLKVEGQLLRATSRLLSSHPSRELAQGHFCSNSVENLQLRTRWIQCFNAKVFKYWWQGKKLNCTEICVQANTTTDYICVLILNSY